MAERHKRECAETGAFLLRRRLDTQANVLPPHFRHSTLQWGWMCRWKNIVWTGKALCPIWHASRATGYTLVGSVKGNVQRNVVADYARDRQRQVLGFGAPCGNGKAAQLNVAGGYAVTSFGPPKSFLEAAQKATKTATAPSHSVQPAHDVVAPSHSHGRARDGGRRRARESHASRGT